MKKTAMQKLIDYMENNYHLTEESRYEFKKALEQENEQIQNAVNETQNMLIVNDIIVATLGEKGTLGEKYYKHKFRGLS